MRILEFLRRNGRMPKSKIAERLGITETAVRKRIRKLEREGIILGYRAVINYRKINMICSFTGIDVEPDSLIDVMKKLKDIDRITAIYLTSGDHDFLVEIVCENVEELERIHKEMARLKGVRRICPAIITEIINLFNR